MPNTFFKDPSALLEYSWDWAPWLAEVSDTIASATVTVSGEITAVGAPVVSDTAVTQRVTGGVVGGACSMVCQITTVGGLIDERSIYLTISER
jgi:hypothetical protein